MGEPLHSADKGERLESGRACILHILGHRYPAQILGVAENTVWVTFPRLEVPVEDQGVDVQLLDEGSVFHTQVVIGPREPGDGAVLRRTASAVRTHRRGAWRVPVQLRARYGVGGPYFDGRVENLSLGGALLVGKAPAELGSRIDLLIEFKVGEAAQTFPSQVIHTQLPDRDSLSTQYQLGLRFERLDASATRDLTWYLWERIRGLYPEEVRALYPRKKKRKR